MTRTMYTLLLRLLTPLVLFHLLWRSRKQTAYRQHWAERFGFYGRRKNTQTPLIWLHAVSVGETRAAAPLLDKLKAAYPQHRFLITHMTPTGRETAASLLDERVSQAYLAYDYPTAVRRFLTHWQPDFGIIMETEIWPNLVAACRQRNIPLLLANGRLSARSAVKYQRYSGLMKEALLGLRGIAAQSKNDAAQFASLGASNVAVLGNVKFDMEPPAAMAALADGFRRRCGPRKVWLCASTREGEEALILDAWSQHKPTTDTPLLLLVPRHPQRFAAVAQLVTSHGLRLQQRSDNAPVTAETDVWLGDSLGEMFAYYQAADLAFVGGSLLDFGCQNLIEPCAVGTPVIIGPSTYNFSQAAADALAAHAAVQIKEAEELVQTALQLLADDKTRNAMGIAGMGFTARHRGATARTMAWIAKTLA